MDQIILISAGPDGTSIDIMSEEELLNRLNDEYYGEKRRFAKPGEKIDFDSFDGLIVIKGQIVRPKPEKVITKFKL